MGSKSQQIKRGRNVQLRERNGVSNSVGIKENEAISRTEQDTVALPEG